MIDLRHFVVDTSLSGIIQTIIITYLESVPRDDPADLAFLITVDFLVDPPTSTISWMEDLSSFESRMAFSTGSNVPLKRSEHSSSKRALLIEV